MAEPIRTAPDVDARIPGGNWTVGDTAVHLVDDIGTNVKGLRGTVGSLAVASNRAPGRVAESLVGRHRDRERDPVVLAERDQATVDEFPAAAQERARPAGSTSLVRRGGLARRRLRRRIDAGRAVVHGRQWPIDGADAAHIASRWPTWSRSTSIPPEGRRCGPPTHTDPRRRAYQIKLADGRATVSGTSGPAD